MEGVEAEAAISPGLIGLTKAEPGEREREARLIKAARKGDPNAIERLIRAHWDGAHRIGWLILGDAGAAEDVAQETMLAVTSSLGRFDGRCPLAAYVHRVASNRALDALRAKAARPPEVDEVAVEAADSAPDPLSDSLQAALGRLEPDDRAAVVLRYLLGYRAAEIGEMLGKPEATVRTRLHRARLLLRSELEDGNVR